MSRKREPPAREQERTPFTRILENVIAATPGARGAALVDELGESVDYAGEMDSFDIRVAGAHMQLEKRKATAGVGGKIGAVRSMVVRATRGSFVVVGLVDGYDLVVVTGRCAPFGLSDRARQQAEHAIRVEGGWRPPKGIDRWSLARVKAKRKDRWRPSLLWFRGRWHRVEVIGAVMGLGRGERGFRVRTEDGAEMTLVRETSGRWFSDASVE